MPQAELSKPAVKSAVTLSLVEQARSGPFLLHLDMERGCAAAAAAGFDAVEIFAPSADSLNARELRRLLTTHGLSLAALGTGAGWLVQRLTLTDPDLEVRARARQFVAGLVDFGGSFGAPAIIGSMQGRVAENQSREQALAWLAESLEQLAPRAHALGTVLLLEPLNRYETNLLNRLGDTAAFLGTLRTRNVRILVDLFHANIEERSISESIESLGPLLGHLHFVDSNRCAPGLGHLDFAPICSALVGIGYQGYASVEALPLPTPEAAAAASIMSFRRLFS